MDWEEQGVDASEGLDVLFEDGGDGCLLWEGGGRLWLSC